MKIYPVVHANTLSQTVEQASLALEAEADGVFLINHSIPDELFLPSAYNCVRAFHKKAFVGLNLLECSDALSAYMKVDDMKRQGLIDKLPNALWVDDAIGRRKQASMPEAIEPEVTDTDLIGLRSLKEMRRFSWGLRKMKLFGGTAFKYTAHYTDNSEAAAAQAAQNKKLIDIVTTTGSGTGSAPATDKVAAMKEALGGRKLALASGVDERNIKSYAGLADMILVASSVETERYSGIFDTDKLHTLIDMAHSLD